MQMVSSLILTEEIFHRLPRYTFAQVGTVLQHQLHATCQADGTWSTPIPMRESK